MQEAHGLDAEVILARATHVLGGSEGLVLFGDGPNTKPVAFTIDNGPKELIRWRFNDRIDRLIAFKPSGKILYTRCTVYWCSTMISYFDEAYSFYKRGRYATSYLLFFSTYSFSLVVWLMQETWSSFVQHATSR